MTDEVRSPEEQAAAAARNRAEAAKFLAEAEKFAAEAREAAAKATAVEYDAQVSEKKARELEELRLAGDEFRRVYRFNGMVNAQSVQPAIDKLTRWHRIDPECAISIIIDSPGGSIIDGFALFDTILWLRANNHPVTTLAQGMAASMAGVILQAGTTRVMSPQASLLVHEASFMAAGSFGEVEDTVEFVKKLQDRILDIFAERSTMTRSAIKRRWTRKNWWLDAQEALKHGFVDEVR